MDNVIYLNETIYPHMMIEDWPAPSLEVALRWRDEMTARGNKAEIVHKWNGYSQTVVVRVGTVANKP